MKKLLAGLLALAFMQAAYAAPPPTPPPTAVLQAQAILSVGSSSSSVALVTGPAPVAITIFNSGATDAYFAQGTSSVVATTSSTLIRAGKGMTVWASGTYLAGITASGSTTFDIYEGNGPMDLSGPGMGGGALPAGAATSANQALQLPQETSTATATGAISTATGAPADTAYTSGSGSIVSILKGIFGHGTADPATGTNQTTANGSLASIATNTTGASTAARQDTGNTSLVSIATNTLSFSRSSVATFSFTPGSAAYSAGQVVGATGAGLGVVTISTGLSNTRIRIQMIGVNFTASAIATPGSYSFLLFNAAPSGTYTDGSALPNTDASKLRYSRGSGSGAATTTMLSLVSSTAAIPGQQDITTDGSGNVYLIISAAASVAWTTPGVSPGYVDFLY